MTFTDGIAGFTLKHGETVTATGLPAGILYTVTEEEAGQDGYKTESEDATGIITEETPAKAAFVNTRNITPDEPDTRIRRIHRMRRIHRIRRSRNPDGRRRAIR